MASTPNKASDFTRWDGEKIDKLTDVVTYQVNDESSEYNTQLKLMGPEKKTLKPFEATDEYSKSVYGRPPPKPVEDKDKKKKKSK